MNIELLSRKSDRSLSRSSVTIKEKAKKTAYARVSITKNKFQTTYPTTLPQQQSHREEGKGKL